MMVHRNKRQILILVIDRFLLLLLPTMKISRFSPILHRHNDELKSSHLLCEWTNKDEMRVKRIKRTNAFHTFFFVNSNANLKSGDKATKRRFFFLEQANIAVVTIIARVTHILINSHTYVCVYQHIWLAKKMMALNANDSVIERERERERAIGTKYEQCTPLLLHFSS